MELRHLRYFTAVAEGLHFTRAARRLRVAQPALSKQVRDLEAELGVALFRRERQRVTLTAAGQSFLRDAREVLAAAERAAEGARRAACGQAGQLRIGYLATLAPPALSSALRALRRSRPEVQLSLTDLPPAQQIAALLDDRLDVGFVTRLTPKEVPVEIETIPVAEHTLAAVLPLDHPLLKRRKALKASLPLHVLAKEPFVLFAVPRKPTWHRWLLAQFAAVGFTPRVVQYAESAESLLDLVAAGVGVTLAVPATAWLGRKDVRFCALAEPAPRFEQSIAFRRGTREQSPLVAALLAELLPALPTRGRATKRKSDKPACQGAGERRPPVLTVKMGARPTGILP